MASPVAVEAGCSASPESLGRIEADDCVIEARDVAMFVRGRPSGSPCVIAPERRRTAACACVPWKSEALQDRAARCDLHGGNTPCVEHQQSIAVPAAQHTGVVRHRGDDVVDDLVFAPRVALLVRDIHAVTADKPDTKHNAFHASAH
jgi:hypothetical protein